MSQYPAQDPYGSYDAAAQQPAKTSVLAILSLICALLCITSPLGLVFGGLAIVVISRSNGRTKGMGLAIAGTVIGLILSTILLVMVVGAAQLNKAVGTMFAAPLGAVLQDVEDEDIAGVRAGLSPTLNAATTDDEIKAFHAELRQNFGAYKTYPSSIFDMITQYGEIGPQMQSLQGLLGQNQAGAMPIPMEFDQGVVLVLIEFPRQGGTPAPGTVLPPLERLGVYIPGSNTIVWIDEAGEQSGSDLPAAEMNESTPGAAAEPAEPVPADEEPGGANP